jgi:hypothetical protein
MFEAGWVADPLRRSLLKRALERQAKGTEK